MELDRRKMSDQQLISEALQKDARAFEELFLRYKKDVHGFFMQKTANNHADASDLTQETFLKVYLNLHRYDPAYSFVSWLRTVARNAFIDFYRKKNDHLLPLNPGEWGASQAGAESGLPTPEESMMQKQSSNQLNHLLDELPIHYRQILILRFLKEYSYEEIAETLRIPMGTVKTRIRRGREMFYELLNNSDIR